MAYFLLLAPVFLGCCSNVVFLEMLTTDASGSGNIITFAQFLFIAVEGFIFTTNFGRKKSVIPLRNYLALVVMFFLVSLTNNYALNFNISMPLHMIIRSGSLIANLILGIFILKRKYKLYKYAAVGMITCGIAVCTIASGQHLMSNEASSRKSEDGGFQFLFWCIGLFLLLFALFTSARMGIYQETLCAKYGKHPRESLFYSHALPLPGFLFLAKDIYNHVIIFNNSEPVELPLLPAVPKLWLCLLWNVLTQYICIRSVYTLTTEYSSLTVTLVVTLRKFVSLLLSVFYFRNPFTWVHWLGTFLVFCGTLMFVDILNIIRRNAKWRKQD